MTKWNGNTLKIGNFVASLPIVQGGMGVGISLSGLASAVANEGGIGVISVAAIGMNEKDFATNYLEANIRALRKEIRRARELTNGIIGINVMVALSNFDDMVRTAIEEGIDIIFAGAGLPVDLPSFLKDNTHTKIVPIVSSGRAADIIAKRWYKRYNYLPDAVVVEGPMAGGHLGFSNDQIKDSAYALENLVGDVINAIKPYEELAQRPIPIIAGGGIYNGTDIHRFLELGAAGIQMGTRFVTTIECDASDAFKQAYINCNEEDIAIIKSPVGMPGRAIKNDYIRDVENNIKKPYNCPYHCIITCDVKSSPYCIALALMNAKKGKLDYGFAFAGQNAYRSKEIISVHELINNITEEYDNAINIEKDQPKQLIKKFN
jgi:nitronate monooxygenase